MKRLLFSALLLLLLACILIVALRSSVSRPIVRVSTLVGQNFEVAWCQNITSPQCYDFGQLIGGGSLNGFVSLWNISTDSKTVTATLKSDLKINPGDSWLLHFRDDSGALYDSCSAGVLNGASLSTSLTYCRIQFDHSFAAGTTFSFQPHLVKRKAVQVRPPNSN
jgi:hypothetical protein